MTSDRKSDSPCRKRRGAAGGYVERNSLVALLLFIPPSLILFVVFVVLPMIDAVGFSFFDWSGYGPMTDFVWLQELPLDVLDAPQLLHLGPQQPASSSRCRSPSSCRWRCGARWRWSRRAWGINVLRLLFFVPYMLAEVAAGLIWRFVYDGDYGLVSAVGNGLGLHPPFVLADKFWVHAGHHGGDRVEVFRLPHDDLHRRPAVDPARGDRGGAARRRQAWPDHPPHQDPDDLVVDRRVDVLRHHRRAAAVRRHHSADQWRAQQLEPHHRHLPLPVRHPAAEDRASAARSACILFVICVGFTIVYRRALFPRERRSR